MIGAVIHDIMTPASFEHDESRGGGAGTNSWFIMPLCIENPLFSCGARIVHRVSCTVYLADVAGPPSNRYVYIDILYR